MMKKNRIFQLLNLPFHFFKTKSLVLKITKVFNEMGCALHVAIKKKKKIKFLAI